MTLRRSEFSNKIRLMTSTLISLIILQPFSEITTVKADDVPCTDDADCSSDQYCYKTSHICVNYTVCSRYNRQENDSQRAKDPSQCGTCLAGYTDDKLTTGTRSTSCYEIGISDNKGYRHFLSSDPLYIGVYIVIGIFITIIIFIALYVFVNKKRVVKIHGNKNWFRRMKLCSFSPTAPYPDNEIYPGTFYNDGPPVYSSINNNKIIKDRNNLERAGLFHTPSWVSNDPNYGHDDPDSSIAATNFAVTSTNNLMAADEEETNPSTWTPEEVIVQVPTRAFNQFATEQRDNVLNTVMVRGDCASNSESADETTTESNTSAAGNSRTNNESYRGPSVQIHQMITLNMIRGDN